MTVYKEKNSKTGKVFYRVDVLWTNPDGTTKRIRRSSPINTQRGAEQFERDVRNALSNGTWGKRRREDAPTLADFKVRYFEAHVAGLKASTRNSYETIWREHILASLGGVRVSELTTERVQRFVTELRAKEHKPKTINNVLSALRKALDIAVDWKVAQRIDVPKMTWAKVTKQRFDFLTFEEAERLRPALVGEVPWEAMITLALMTGLRQGELIALRWGDISVPQKQLTVSRSVWQGIEAAPKNGKVRHIPLNSIAIDALAKLKRGKADTYVFANRGARLTKGECKWPLYRVAARAELGRRIGWHVLRHTFASHLVMRGVPLKAVQELMGHATIEMTMRYSHLAPGHLQSAVAALEPAAPKPAQRPTNAHPSAYEVN